MKLLRVIFFLIIVFLVGIAVVDGIRKQEIKECLSWQKHLNETSHEFSLAAWQRDQCEARGIKLDAPLKGEQ